MIGNLGILKEEIPSSSHHWERWSDGYGKLCDLTGA